jgi:hypothetical protein
MRRSGLSSTFEALQKWGDYPAFLWSCRFSSFRVLFLNWAGHIHSTTSDPAFRGRTRNGVYLQIGNRPG